MAQNGQNITEYLRTGHQWLNTVDYTPLQATLFFSGCVFWIICYIDTIRDIRRKKTINIPLGCVVTNYGWELSASLIFLPNMGKLLVGAYWAWMLLDTYIFISALRYGYKQCQVGFFKKNIRLLLLVGLACAAPLMATFMTQYDLPMAALSGEIINAYMSVAFLYLAFIPGFEGNSLVTGWSKFIGTALINIMFYLRYPDNYFLMVLYGIITLFDLSYIYLLYAKRKERAAPILQPVG